MPPHNPFSLISVEVKNFKQTQAETNDSIPQRDLADTFTCWCLLIMIFFCISVSLKYYSANEYRFSNTPKYNINFELSMVVKTNINILIQQKPSNENPQTLSTVSQQHQVQQPYFRLEKYPQPRQTPWREQFCIVSYSEASRMQDILSSFQRLKRDQNQDWFAVYFVQRGTDIDTDFIEAEHTKIKVLYSHGSRLKNIYDAVYNHCQPHSIILLLDWNECFSQQNVLDHIAQYFDSDPLLALMFLPIRFTHRNSAPFLGFDNFNRNQYLNPEILSRISDTFRLFRRQLFFQVSIEYLRDRQNVFYDEPWFFMGSALELMRQEPEWYLPLSYQMDFPAKFTAKNITILSFARGPETISQMAIATFKEYYEIDPFTNCVSYIQYNEIKEIHSRFNLKPTSAIGQFKQKRKPIPKIVHIVELYETLPPIKAFLFKKNLEKLQGFEIKRWTYANLTRRNFPITYDKIQEALEVDKTFEYSRLSMVSDFIRFEAVFRHGGFYIDLNYLLFQPLDLYLDYTLVFPAANPSFHLIGQNCGFFGAIPHSQQLARIVKPEVINHIDVKGKSSASGPGLFARALTWKDYSDPNVKLFRSQDVYPYYPWLWETRGRRHLCTYWKSYGVPIELQADHPVVFETQTWLIIGNCSSLYPHAIGTDFFEFGGSWISPRAISKP